MYKNLVVDEFKDLKQFYCDERFHTRTFQEQRKHVLSLLGQGEGLVLEIGSGPAMLCLDITRLGYTYVAMDLVFDMLHAAKDNVSEHGGFGLIADVFNQPFKDNAFKSVVGMGVLEYVSDLQKVLDEIHRVSSTERSVIITVPHRSSPYRKSVYAWRHIKYIIKWLVSSPCTRIQGNVEQVLTPKEWREAAYNAGFTVVKDAYCYFRLIPEPFNSWIPTFAENIGAKLEILCKRGPLRMFGTQYVMKLVPHSGSRDDID